MNLIRILVPLNLLSSHQTMTVDVGNNDSFGNGHVLHVVLKNTEDVGLRLCATQVNDNV